MTRLFTAALAALLALVSASVPVHAQSTQSALQGQITNTLPDNATGAITPLIVRNMLNAMVLSSTCPGPNQVLMWNASSGPACISGTSSQVLHGGTPPVFGSVANADMATMAASTIKGRAVGAGTGVPQDLTGAQAEAILQFTQSGTGAISNRSVDSKLKDWVSALDFAVGDCSTDDSTNIQNAINSLTIGGIVYFPPAPGGCYAIGSGTAITLPNTKTITLLGSGRSDNGATTSGGTILKATAAITAMISSPTTFARGNQVRSMNLECNKNAQYGLKLDHTVMGTFADLAINDCTLRGIRVGTGAGNSQENTFISIRLDNPQTTVLANLPDYNFETLGDFINNDIYSIKAVNAKLSNFNIGGSGNKWVNIHGYDFFSGAAQSPVNNIIISSFNDIINGCETDGSSAANISITGFANTIANCTNQGNFSQVGVSFANNTSGNVVFGHQFHQITAANTIVQAGTGGNPGNYYFGNWSDAASAGLFGSIVTNTIPSTITAGCNGAGSSVQAPGNKFYGRVTGQTAAVTTCTVTFNGGGFSAVPVCNVTGEQSAILTVVPSATTLVVTFANTANYRFSYTCVGNG